MFLTEDIILDVDEPDLVDDFDKVDLDDFDVKDDLLLDEPGDNYEDFTEDFSEDFTEDQFDDLPFFEDKDDDYY